MVVRPAVVVDFVRPGSSDRHDPVRFHRMVRLVDQVLATLTDDDLARSPYPHFRHPIPRAGPEARSHCSAMPRTRCRPSWRRGPIRRCSTRWCCARRFRISDEQQQR